MRHLSVLCAAAVALLAFIVSCSKKTNPVAPPPEAATQTTIYISGCFTDGSPYACFWKDGALRKLPGDGVHYINNIAIAVYNGTAYCAGSYSDGSQTIACYWRDTIRYDLGYAGTEVSDIAVIRGSVYCAMKFGRAPGYWRDGSQVILPCDTVAFRAYTSGIAADGGIVFLGGYLYASSPSRYQPVYWKGDSLRYLPCDTSNMGFVFDIAVSGGIAYSCGVYYINNRRIPCYWVDTVRHDLPTISGGEGDAASIAVSGGTVYIGGYVYDGIKRVPCYWTNGIRTYLPGGSDLFNGVSAIAVSGGTVYCAGNIHEGSKRLPCYWVGTTRHDLEVDSTVTQCYGSGIAIQ